MSEIQNTKPAQVKLIPETLGGEIKSFMWLGIPLAFAQLVQFMVYTIDAVMIGRLGQTELAASSLGIVMFFIIWMLGSGAVFAVTPLVSQAIGANQNERHDVRITVRMSLWLVMFLIPLAIAFAAIAYPISMMTGQDPEVSKLASDYLWMLIPGFPFALGIMALRNFLASIDKTWVPLALTVLVVAFNTGLNYVLIYGNLGFPRLELVGAGIASSMAYAFSFALFGIYCYVDKQAKSFRIFKRFWRPHWSRFRKLVKLGWPMSVTTFFEGMLFNVCVFVVGIIGVAEQAAYHVGLNVAALCFMLPFGMSMAGSVRVGHAAGAGNLPALKRASYVTFGICMILMAALALFVANNADMITGFYLSDSEAAARTIAASFLPIAAAFMLFDAAQVVANQLLRGMKDVNWPMLYTGVSYWIVGFPVVIWLGLYTPLGAVGVWYGLMAGLAVAAITLGWRFYHLVWRRPEVIFERAAETEM